MNTFQKSVILIILIGQLGCSSLESKSLSSKSDRLPANQTGIVMLLGAERNSENVQSENLVGDLFISLQNNFRYCYEKQLSSNSDLKGTLFFYFGVTQNGILHHITNESIHGTGDLTALTDCVSTAISRARAPKLNQDLSFRARLTFQAGQ